MKKNIINLLFLLLSFSLFSQEKLDQDLSGNWKSNSGAIFKIVKTDKGIKVCNVSYSKSWAYFKKENNIYVAYKVEGTLYSKNFIGSKITIADISNLVIFNNEDNRNYYWEKDDNSSNNKKDTKPDYPDSRILYTITNYDFQGGEADLDRMERFTALFVKGNQHDGLSMSRELIISWGDYNTYESSNGTGIMYEDFVIGYAIGGIIGIGSRPISLYLRAVGGIMYQWGEIKTFVNYVGTTSELSNFVFYYNAAIGCDLYLGKKFGLSVEAGISSIPIISVGIVW